MSFPAISGPFGGISVGFTLRERGPRVRPPLALGLEGTLSTCLAACRIRPLVTVSTWFRHPFYYSPSIFWGMFWSATNNGGRKRSTAEYWQAVPSLIWILPEVEVDLTAMVSGERAPALERATKNDVRFA